MKTLRLAGLAGALALCAGCGKMAIEGTVVDAGGKPVTGATVNAVGTTCHTTVDDQGKFILVCDPGTYTLVIAQTGYISIQIDDFEATERKRYNLGKKVLIKIPDQKGLFLMRDDSYEPMKPGLLVRRYTTAPGRKERSFCLDRDNSEPNELKAGTWRLFDNASDGWRPFKLDDQGCAYRDYQDAKLRWHIEYKQKPSYEEHKVGERKKIALLKLDPGDYFVADWDHGFFTPTETNPDDKNAYRTYSGYWLHVGANAQ